MLLPVTFLSAARPVTVMPLSCSVFSYHAAKLSGSATFPFAPVPVCCANEAVQANTNINESMAPFNVIISQFDNQ